jgi:hypothetical protein
VWDNGDVGLQCDSICCESLYGQGQEKQCRQAVIAVEEAVDWFSTVEGFLEDGRSLLCVCVLVCVCPVVVCVCACL